MSECPDDDKDWYPQRRICWPAAQLEVAKRKYAALHEDEPFHDGTFKNWAKEFSWAYPFHYADGISLFMSPIELAPWDDFTEVAQASPDEPQDEPSDDPAGDESDL